MVFCDSKQYRATQLHLHRNCSTLPDMLHHYVPVKYYTFSVMKTWSIEILKTTYSLLYLEKIFTVTLNSLLSGCGFPSPPVALHGPVGLVPSSFGKILTPVGGQNHPLIKDGFKSSRSHPSKLHFRPDVQVNRCCPWINLFFRSWISSGVSMNDH